ncbi:MAG: 16S rRNA (adenine(1518)-N(6)/adenine(1519)-N(6))-dimethyltransferase RsmA [Gammaproteobacteria bacterium]
MNDHRPRKHFGQNFLHDRNIIAKILAAVAAQPDDHFVEIGPGHGALTQPLLQQVAGLDVVEIDRDLAAAIERDLDDPRLTVHRADALRFDFATIAGGPASLRLVGNLPYNISTPLLFHFLDYSSLFRDAHVMLQKEVVERMAAVPGNKTYGRLTVSLAARCRVESLFIVKPGSFTPAPRVDSAVARLTPDPDRRGRIADEAAFDKVVAQAFNQRRKQLANALRNMITHEQIESLGIDPETRAETLDVEAFIRLGNFFAELPGMPEDSDNKAHRSG